jgi:ATP-dependent Lon protease
MTQMIGYSDEAGTRHVPLLPLKNVVLLPRSIRPIIVGRDLSIKAVEEALKHDKTLFVTAQKEVDTENPTANDVFHWGTRSTILQVMRMPKGALKILVEGISRSRMLSSKERDGFIEVEYEDVLTENLESSVDIEALWRHLNSLYSSYCRLNDKAPDDLLLNAKSTEDFDALADTLAVHVNLTFHDRQNLLETPDLKERLLTLCTLIQKEIDILEAEERIRGRVQGQVEKSQKEYYLNEQMKAIQKELGRDDQSAAIEETRKKIKKLKLPKEVLERVEKELTRLEQMPPLSSEAVVVRNFIDWIASLPWNKITKDSISLVQAEKILNKSHAGLNKVKERIVEFIAAQKFAGDLESAPILCLVGPPGVGKTSLAKSIAKSLGRAFVRISLGGVRDEAEIRGHRRTYIGSMPGKIIQAMRKAKAANPVILLDEIDKMSHDMHGDPSSALLEVLDPEQNKNFADHYLEVDYDLSKILFITTANMVDTIPYPLFDRMEILSLSGYTKKEKLSIARKFLLPKQLKKHKLNGRKVKVSDEIIAYLIEHYTREAGVRQLERIIAKLMRKSIQLLMSKKAPKSVTVSMDLIKEWMGYKLFKPTDITLDSDRIGLATGLAWTEVGGDVLEIETIIVPGKGGLTLTGQLGDVMQESAQAALSYVRTRSKQLNLTQALLTDSDIHIHIPEGATPKDGPSAGISMCTSLISALTQTPVLPEIAMTGEITLRGRVLAVGGLKEKILGAIQQGIKTVLVPNQNKEEVEEITKDFEQTINIVFVEHMDDVLKHAFAKKPVGKKAVTKKKPTQRKKILTTK